MSEPSQFRHYQIIQDADGNNVELVRNAEQVAVLAFDMQRLEYVHCHVLLEALSNRAAFEESCQALQKRGHPALARLIECGEDEGNPFYITSNIDGEPLRPYLARQQDIPGWLAIMIACRALETAVAVCERGDFLTETPLDSFRVVQTTPQTVQVLAADFRVIDNAAKKRALKTGFEKQAKFLRSFLTEQGGGPTLADHLLPAADFTELLASCLDSAGVGAIAAMRELRGALQKLAPDHPSGEVPTAQKPRALLAPLLASYQEVARGLVNLVRIQSQRLDMANPYSMRGTLTKTGRSVLIEQVPPARIACARVKEVDESAFKVTKQRDYSGLVTLALVNEAEDITCLAEEIVEGISLADLMRERRYLDVQEAYLVLAGLDSALAQIDLSTLPVSKLRLEDIFLLTGFAREDSRSTKLLVSKLNEWPAFNVLVRAHPTLAAMSGRGTDPTVLLPPAKNAPAAPWHGGWLAALCKFLLGLESPVGVLADPAGGARERETVARLLDDEIAKVGEAKPALRSDFLARYARIIQHYDLVKPSEPGRAGGTDPAVELGLKPAPKTIPVTKPAAKAAALPSAAKRDAAAAPAASTSPLRSPVPLTTGGATKGDESHIGFAELLFRNAGGDPSPPDSPDWARAAASAPPTLPADLIPADDVPFWLKAAVFMGGSMCLGAIIAHLSGDALWQKKPAPLPVEAVKSQTSAVATATPIVPVVSKVPKALPVEVPPVVVAPPPDEGPERGRGVTLSLPPGSGGLREQLAAPANPPAPPP
ncbi:MAG: hypothetical protein IAE77_16695 [Prosthecobacter sp.]|jgi:hypothetical protein|uniref:hypothetical protein n=1 Tax=Prosthecobacter sp. TaxID=1965333 RepID=UPI0019F89C4B|nr:hypothetical protein [Prosthecobacter sp.]MBE2285101.1 hypothetical protein [Prosthecobacter sp.]